MPTRVDVPALYGAQNPNATEVVAPNFKPTNAQRRRLEQIARAVATAWAAEIREELLPIYRDALRRRAVEQGLGLTFSSTDVDRITQALDASAARVTSSLTDTDEELRLLAVQVAAWHTERFSDAIRRATNVDISSVLTVSDVDEQMRSFVQQNVRLITKLDAETRGRIEGSVLRAWDSNNSANELRKELRRDLGFSAARAKLIGRDQISKLTGQLDRLRLEHAGIDQYEWVHSLLPNERPEHLARHGERFKVGEPAGDTPGQAIQCRCRAKAVIKPKQPDVITQ